MNLCKILIACSILISNPIFSQNLEVCLTSDSVDHRYASYSPDGKSIVYESNKKGNWDIYVMDSDGKNPTPLTSSLSNQRRPSWHPDGTSILYEEVEQNAIASIHLETGQQKTILDQKTLNKFVFYGKMQFASFDPKGERVVFTLVESDTIMNLVIFNLKMNSLEEVFLNPYRTAYGNWNEKGNILVFHSRHNTQNISDDLYSLNLKDNSIKQLTSWIKHDFCPMFSPDGKKIAFVRSMEDKRPEIMLMNSDGSAEIQLTDNEDGETLPNWSPSGEKLLITAYRNGHYQICEIKIP